MAAANTKKPFHHPVPKQSNTAISVRPTPLNAASVVSRRPFGYSQTAWGLFAQHRFLHPKFSKLPFRVAYMARWGPVAALAAYFYLPYSDWYVRNGWKFITGQEPEDMITTDRSRFFNYSY